MAKKHLKQKVAGEVQKYVLNPAWSDSEEAAHEKETIKNAILTHPFARFHEVEDAFPEDYGKELPEEGAWIRVNSSPNCEYTVPPFSMWRASRWYMDASLAPIKRVKIITPKGDLGLSRTNIAS